MAQKVRFSPEAGWSDAFQGGQYPAGLYATPAEWSPPFGNFSYGCPERVLAKIGVLVSNGVKKTNGTFFRRTGPVRGGIRIIAAVASREAEVEVTICRKRNLPFPSAVLSDVYCPEPVLVN